MNDQYRYILRRSLTDLNIGSNAFRTLVLIINSHKPTREYIGRTFKKHPQTVYRWLLELKDAGYIRYVCEHDDIGVAAGGYYEEIVKKEGSPSNRL